MKDYNIAIVGATGLVGQTFLKILEESDISIKELRLFASEKSKGKRILFKGKKEVVDIIEEGSFKGIDFALFSAGASASKRYAPQATKEGAVVIDNSSAFRMLDDYPLVVPEVNLSDAFKKTLIANPNCSTIQAVIPLYALDNAFEVCEVTYNTYQAVSGSGYKGLEALKGNNTVYPYDIQKTCIPQIGAFLEDGYTEEEIKMIEETKKILHKKNLLVSATCIRVPVEYSHGVSIRVKLQKEFHLEAIKDTLIKQPGLVVLDEPKKQIYPVSQVATGNDSVYIGRIRRDKIDNQTVLMYCVADNVRKGAASNAIQIMRGLMEHA